MFMYQYNVVNLYILLIGKDRKEKNVTLVIIYLEIEYGRIPQTSIEMSFKEKEIPMVCVKIIQHMYIEATTNVNIVYGKLRILQ